MSQVNIKTAQVSAAEKRLLNNKVELALIKESIINITRNIDGQISSRRNIGNKGYNLYIKLGEEQRKLEEICLFLDKSVNEYIYADDFIKKLTDKYPEIFHKESGHNGFFSKVLDYFSQKGEMLKKYDEVVDWLLKKFNDGVSDITNSINDAVDRGFDGFEEFFGIDENNQIYKYIKDRIKEDIGVIEGATSEVLNMATGILALAAKYNPEMMLTRTEAALADLIRDPDKYIKAVGDGWQKVEYAVKNKDKIIDAISNELSESFIEMESDPIKRGQFAGHAAVFIASFFVGAGEVNAVSKIAKADEAVNALDKVEKVANEVNKVAKGAEAVNKLTSNLKMRNLVTKTADDVNVWWKTVKGYTNPPYTPGKAIIEFELEETTTFVRVYDDVNSFQKGGWLIKQEDIAGLTAQQIRDKYALPSLPKYITDVKIPSGTRLRIGEANPLPGWGNGGGTQIDLMGQYNIGEKFFNPRPLE